MLAKTLVQRHLQHVANTSDAPHEAACLALEVIAPEGIRRLKAITVAERDGRTWAHPAVTLVQRHLQHVVNTFNARHEAVRFAPEVIAPEVIRRPKAITVAERNGRRCAHPAVTLVQRHPQHVANTFNAPHEAVRRAPEVIAPEGIRRPKAIAVAERNGRTWIHPAVTLVQRHLQHVASTFNASHEAVRLAPEPISRPRAITVAEQNGRTWAHAVVSAPFRPVVMTAPGSSRRPVQRRGEGRPSVVEGMRSPLYAQPAARSYTNHLAATTAQQAPAPEQRSAPPPPAHVQALQPQIDLGRLSEDVYQHIQRKIRIERERRGL